MLEKTFILGEDATFSIDLFENESMCAFLHT